MDQGLRDVPASLYMSMILRALAIWPSLSNESLASTSVETLPGTILRISHPNSTNILSTVLLTESSSSPRVLPQATALKISHTFQNTYFLNVDPMSDYLKIRMFVLQMLKWAFVSKCQSNKVSRCVPVKDLLVLGHGRSVQNQGGVSRRILQRK